MDPIDRMLQGDDQAAVPTGNEGQTEAPQAQPTEEEVEFNKLSGSAQERFREALRRARDAENKLADAQAQQTYVPPAPSLAPDQEQAIQTLEKFGVATDRKVDQRVAEGINQVRWELRNQNLQQKYSGSDGKPQYNPDEVLDYMRTHPQYLNYDPEDVFKFKMYPDEFSSVSTEQPSRPKTQSLRPTKSFQRQDALTPEYIEERLKQPDADEWYEANKDEINAVVRNHTLKFNNDGSLK